jgi:thiol:disulfide interchange protein DsbD
VAVSLGYKDVYRYPEGFPEWHDKGLPSVKTDFSDLSAQLASPSPNAAVPPRGLTLLLTLLGVFMGGMALNLTPCVYPLIPITISYFGGRSGKSQGKLAAHGFCYLMGLAATNSILGVTAAMTGGLMGSILQNSWVLLGVALVLIIFASSLFGIWELQLPSGLTQVASKSYAGYFGTFFMGLTLGVIAAPCIGPFVLGLLTWVASIAQPWFGFAVFFTLSLGLGIPLVVLALFSGRLEKLPRSGEWMIWVRKAMGWVLVGMAVFFVRPLLPKTASVFAYSFIAISAGIHLAWIDKSTASFASFKWLKKGAGLVGVSFGVYVLSAWLIQGPGVTWQPYSDQLLTQSMQENKPVIIDFYATWCAPCRKLDESTFHDQGVVQATENITMIKLDLTAGDNPIYQQLVRQFDIKGVPTVVFLDKTGQERLDLRLVEFMKPQDFIAHMNKLSSCIDSRIQ